MLKVGKIDNAKDLAVKYPGQFDRQGVFVELDCKNEILTVNYNGEVGSAVPTDVWHGHTIRFDIPLLSTETINDLLDQIAPIARRVISGYDTKWDGHNIVPDFSEDAQEAIAEIEEIVNQYDEDEIAIWSAEDWLDGCEYKERDDDGNVILIGWGNDLEITAESTESDMERIADTLKAELDENTVVKDIFDYIQDQYNYYFGK